MDISVSQLMDKPVGCESAEQAEGQLLHVKINQLVMRNRILGPRALRQQIFLFCCASISSHTMNMLIANKQYTARFHVRIDRLLVRNSMLKPKGCRNTFFFLVVHFFPAISYIFWQSMNTVRITVEHTKKLQIATTFIVRAISYS